MKDGITNPVKAIRAYCIDCCNGSSNEVKLCPADECQLHPFRLGKNPYRTKRELTDEQKAKVIKGLTAYREKKNAEDK